MALAKVSQVPNGLDSAGRRQDAANVMLRIFRNFVQELEASQDAASLQTAMSNVASALGLQCFAYLQTPRDNRQTAGLISNYPPEWTDHYLKQHYERLDPVIARAHMREEPFEWGVGADNQRLSTEQARFFDEAAEFGIRCGLTILLRDGLGPVAASNAGQRWTSMKSSGGGAGAHLPLDARLANVPPLARSRRAQHAYNAPMN